MSTKLISNVYTTNEQLQFRIDNELLDECDGVIFDGSHLIFDFTDVKFMSYEMKNDKLYSPIMFESKYLKDLPTTVHLNWYADKTFKITGNKVDYYKCNKKDLYVPDITHDTKYNNLDIADYHFEGNFDLTEIYVKNQSKEFNEGVEKHIIGNQIEFEATEEQSEIINYILNKYFVTKLRNSSIRIIEQEKNIIIQGGDIYLIINR